MLISDWRSDVCSSDLIGTAEFVVDRHVSWACRAVDAHAPVAMRDEPAADVECAADMLGPGIVDGQAIEFLATGALGHQIDAAADSRTPRGRAVSHRKRGV